MTFKCDVAALKKVILKSIVIGVTYNVPVKDYRYLDRDYDDLGAASSIMNMQAS